MHECLRRLHCAAATLHLYVHDIRGEAEIPPEPTSWPFLHLSASCERTFHPRVASLYIRERVDLSLASPISCLASQSRVSTRQGEAPESKSWTDSRNLDPKTPELDQWWSVVVGAVGGLFTHVQPAGVEPSCRNWNIAGQGTIKVQLNALLVSVVFISCRKTHNPAHTLVKAW